jgi:hypothetical protein
MTAARNDTGRRRDAAALGAAGWLGHAAAPTFAVMALLTYVPGEGADMMCPAEHGMSPLSGMVPMYVLMSAFHSAPWLKLISRRRSAARRSGIRARRHRRSLPSAGWGARRGVTI